jgi:thiol:disulfide interchange protein DsbA
MKKIAYALLLFVFIANPVLAEFKAGVDYKVLEPQETSTGDKIEVLEFFWYGCPHCNTFEPFLKKWKQSKPDNVEFIRVPAVFRPSWKVQARAYYALQTMGKLEEVHGKIFHALHKERKKLDTMKKIAAFVAEQGVDKEAFIKNYQSFSIDGKVRKANKLVKNYQIAGVPTVAINGKYKVSGKMAGSYDRMIEIMDYLIKVESK